MTEAHVADIHQSASKQTANQTGPQRIEYIDGLRAIAVLGVLFYHAHASFRLAGFDHTYTLPGVLLDEGRHGVDLFFVISGFCLSFPVLSRLAAGKDTAFSAPLFFAKRLVASFHHTGWQRFSSF